jgi:hypothetical protein
VTKSAISGIELSIEHIDGDAVWRDTQADN